MNIQDLDLPARIIRSYLDSGIEQLYPPQAEAVEKGLLNGNNILAAIPTASGKTMIAEMPMLKAAHEGAKCLYIVPLRALASEKYERFRDFSPPGIRTGISTGDFDSRDEWLGSNDIIIATSEKTDSLLRNGTGWMKEVTTIVIDEIHLLDSPVRGPTLEITIARLIHLNPDAQIIGLSATIGNAEQIAGWLNAELIKSNWRPTDLHEGVFFASNINFIQAQEKVECQHKDPSMNLISQTTEEGNQCLIFENSRKNAMAFAKDASRTIAKLLSRADLSKLELLEEKIAGIGETQLAKDLAGCVKNGVAFHHAGLTAEQRKLIEKGFRDNSIKIICSTPTLAAGLNLPARRVIIRNYKRYDPDRGMQPIPVFEYKQMAGRAGRPGLDPYGQSILIAQSYNELAYLLEHYIQADAEPIYSKLGTENALRTHILSTISGGSANNREQLMDFLRSTFYSYQQQAWDLEQILDECLEFLESYRMIRRDRQIKPTTTGKLVSVLYIDPLSAAHILDGLHSKTDINELTLLHLISRTPDMRRLYLRARDYQPIIEFVRENKEHFAKVPDPLDQIEYEWFLSEVKTALMLLRWINETKVNDIAQEFGIAEGDIRAIADTAEWIMHATHKLAPITGKNTVISLAHSLEKRIHYGIKDELAELVQLKNVGRNRGRKIYDAGLHSPQDIVNADMELLLSLLGKNLSGSILSEATTFVRKKVIRTGLYRYEDGSHTTVSKKTLDSILEK